MQLKYSALPKAILLLEDGKVFEGKLAFDIVETKLDSLPKKLQDWYVLSYKEFIKELEKK